MTQQEQTVYFESILEEIQMLLTSMNGLMILTEHYSNPKETNNYIAMLSRCVSKLEGIIEEARYRTISE